MHLTSIRLIEATQSLLDTSDYVQLRFEEETMTREKTHTFLVETQLAEAQSFISSIREDDIKIFTYLNPQLIETITLNDILVYRQILHIPGDTNRNEEIFKKFRTKTSFVTVKQDNVKGVLNEARFDSQHEQGKDDEMIKVGYHNQGEPDKVDKSIESEDIALTNSEYDHEVKEDVEGMMEGNLYDITTLNEAYSHYIDDVSAEIQFSDLMDSYNHQLDEKKLNILHVAFDYGRLMNEQDESVSLKQSYLRTTSQENIIELIDEVYTNLNEEGLSNTSFIFEEYIDEVRRYDEEIFERYIEQVSDLI